MPQYLSLVIDEALVRGLVADVSGGRVDLIRAFEARPPASLLSPETSQNQSWLRETLARHDIKSDQVFVTVARDLGLMRRLDIPAVPQSEWPVHVGFQARTKLAQPLDSLAWDFLPSPKDDKGNSAQLAALSKDSLKHLQTALAGTGLKLAQIHLTPLALMEFLAQAQPSHRLQQIPAAIVVNRIDDRLELTLLQQGLVTATHAARISPDERQFQQILAEVTRASLAFQKQLPNKTPTTLFLNAPTGISGELSDALQKRFGQLPELLAIPSNVSTAKLVEGDSFDFSHYLEAIGMLLAQTGKVQTIDLLAPRRPQPKRDYRKRKIAILAVGVLAVIGTGSGLYAKNWAEQSRKINALKQEDATYDPFLQRGEPILKSGTAIEDWLLTKIDPLDEIRQFTAYFPGGDRMYLTEIQFDPIVGSNAAGLRGTISVHGKAQERIDIIKLEEKLIKLPGKYQVIPHKVKPLPPTPPGQQPQKLPYSVEFDMTVNIARIGSPPAEKPAEVKPTDGKPADAKPGDTKPEENKSGEAKPGDVKPPESAPAVSPAASANPAEAKPDEKPTAPAAAPAAPAAQKAPPTETKPAATDSATPPDTPAPASTTETKSDSATTETTGGKQ